MRASDHPVTRLIIHSHPVANSLSQALFAAAIDGLTTAEGQAPAAASLIDGDGDGDGDGELRIDNPASEDVKDA